MNSLVAGLTAGSDTQSLSSADLFTGSYDVSCISTGNNDTLIAPQFVLEADHYPRGYFTTGGVTYTVSEYQRVYTPTGGATDLLVGLLSTPVTNATPAEVLPADYSTYLVPSPQNPIYAVRADQDHELALSDWEGTTTDPDTVNDSGETEISFSALSSSDPLYQWGTEPDTHAVAPISGDSGSGVFVFFDGQTVLLGGLHYPTSCSDVAAFNTGVNEAMSSLWNEYVSTTEPAEQLTTVDLSGFAPVPSLTLTGGQSQANTTQSLSYTVTVTPPSGFTVADGESVVLEDSTDENAVVGSGTFTGDSATVTIPAGTLSDGLHGIFAAYAGNMTVAAADSSLLFVSVSPAVTSVQVNGNNSALAGAQRSMVDSIVFTFSEPVNCGMCAFSIGLDSNAQVDGSATTVGTLPTLSWTAISPATDGSSTQWVVTFSGDGVVGGSIANGVYQVNLNGDGITSDANPGVNAQYDSYLFYRLFGDIDGDGGVSIADFNQFSTAFGSTSGSPSYVAGFDYNNDGGIGIDDFNQFSEDFGTTYST